MNEADDTGQKPGKSPFSAIKTAEDAHVFSTMIAGKQGWVLNPDPDFTGDLEAGLATNKNRYGYYLCPCRDSLGSQDKDRKAICPCEPAHRDIEEFGHCFCALYLSRDFAASGKAPAGIPDRCQREEN